MDNEPIDAAVAEKKEKIARTMRVIWSILIVIFGFLLLFRLYDWSRGGDGLRHILSPLGMIFVGLANIFGARNKNLRIVLTAIAMILVVSALITLFVY